MMRASRFQGRQKADSGHASGPCDFIRQGGIRRREHVAGADAADWAIERERQFWPGKSTRLSVSSSRRMSSASAAPLASAPQTR